MEEKLNYIEAAEQPIAMHPKKFALWLFIVTVVMIFAALTSAYIVRQSEGNWLEFDLPEIFWYSSGIIVLSSLTFHWAYISAKKDNLQNLRIGMVITSVLGVVFLVSQWYGWIALVERDVYFVGNPAGSFLYVFTGLHGLHLVSGVIFLIIVLISSFRYKVHSKQLATLEMCVTFWHFLGGLWLYLFMFLLLNH
ncbi:cytochrome oxidase subunit III [Rhodonellum psychrophilum GCM71 = DSM 17998]|uniref:Cytochrome oxidase subunit III n=2 Tax=Rhodonellum TaxID=336827 RepID=U5BZY4_9BACT|nr:MULTISPECIES: cytochrome c oxidase subunit 3 [Rhodonellum]ERM83129.1 cytochrome oxidase subunit III [Rhodonellum psychrophilum GCM71 = DSM 17998]MDO9554032.1 cytochrome c oxidase subunit 3 [Rhodonellum sp.]SDY98414.1 cytochrome c oxidase subunit 3 [Rhodonellum ikkaensis]